MPPPFIALNIQEFKQLLHAWQPQRLIDEIHMHHTWEPNHAQFRGHESIAGMWRVHTQDNGWRDIAQHVTIDPQGAIWTGRHWDQPPASSAGRNGSPARGPFMFELIGNFDEGRDTFQNPQRDAALWVISLVQDRFELPPESLKFHRHLGSPKSCPGSAIDYEEVLAAVKELRGNDVPKTRQRGARVANYDPVLRARQWLAETPARAGEAEGAEPSERVAYAREIDGSGRGRGRAARAPKLDPPTLHRLRPHVINLADGRLSEGGRFRTDEGDVRRIFEEELPRRVRRLGNGEKLPIVLYAHGGLVDEDSGLTIAATQTPWWVENDIYPIAFVWETGLSETLARMIGLGSRALAERAAATDDLVEWAVRRANGKSIWQAMKFAAAHAFEAGGGGTITLKHLETFLAASGDKVRFHAVGHSAGSIFHSYLLPKLFELNATVDSLSLLAPAITVADFKARLAPHVGSRIQRLVMFTMGKDAELNDSVTPLYRKSLLYLIHRALEPRIGEPILGLEESVRADDALRKLFGLGTQAGKGSVVWSPTDVTTGRHASTSATHGGFDDNAPTMESVVREVLNLPDAAPVLPFPVDQVSRQARLQAQPEASPADAALTQASVMAAGTAPAAEAAAFAPPVAAGGTGRRLALCVGIDEYPDPADRLGGCVADARDWAAALAGLGFQVQSLHNGAATMQQILQRLADLIAGAQAGDTIALQFAAHGTQLEDTDGDEDDDRDEAFCPVDYADGHFIVDDDFRALFANLKPGVALTCFFDTCNSGTITRLGVGRAAPPPVARARFLRATPAMNRAHRAFREARKTRAPASAGRSAMRHVVFAACQPHQSALESDGRGHFSLRAVPLLANAAGRISNKAFSEQVTAAFGAHPQQNPNLDCADASQNATFLFSGTSAGAGRGLLAGLNGAGCGHRADDLVALTELVARLSH